MREETLYVLWDDTVPEDDVRYEETQAVRRNNGVVVKQSDDLVQNILGLFEVLVEPGCQGPLDGSDVRKLMILEDIHRLPAPW